MSGAEDTFPDWDPDAATEDEEQTLTVAAVAERIAALLAAGFPRPFWLVGEASGLQRTLGNKSGHWYFKLVDEQSEGDRRPSLDVKMWRSTVQKLFGPRGRLRGRLQPADGIVLRVLVTPDFWAPGGQISFTIADVDPEHTLGSLDRLRREVLAGLAAEGADRWNKARPLPEVPLRIGLVTSQGSAAEHDVLQTLAASGIGFRVLCCDARTQGAETGPSVCAALATLSRRPLDAILLVRGGGSRLDLSWFDREDVARAVATCPLPVLTGIGHEIDLSVTDAMAHQHFKTPTAAAEFLVQRGRDARAALDDGERRLVELVGARLLAEERALADASRRLPLLVGATLEGADRSLREEARHLGRLARTGLEAADLSLRDARARIGRVRPGERLVELGARLEADSLRLGERAAALLARLDERLDAAAARARLLDPRSVLQRGYAWLRRPDGRIVKEVAAARVGDPLVAVLRDGRIDVLTEAVHPEPPHPSSS